jgi:hypothetical protein
MQTLKNLTMLQWVGIIILFNGTVIGGTSELADLLIPAVAIKAIVAVCSMGNVFLGGLVTMFSSQGSLVRTVNDMPGIDKLVVNASANHVLAAAVVSDDPSTSKLEAAPGAAQAIAATAK